jgi:drug/metabolite transporter (DMT)-like permease
MSVQPSHRGQLATALLVCASVLWGGSFIAARVALREISPVTLATVRFSLAAVFFVVLLVVAPRYRAARRELPVLAFYGTLTITLYFILQYNGVERTSASLSAMVIALSPLVVVILSSAFLKEGLTGRQVLGIVVATAGAILLVTRGSLEVSGSAYWLGVLFLSLDVLAWGVYNVLSKRTLRSQHPTTLTAHMIILGAVGLWPFAAVDGGFKDIAQLSLTGWLAIGYLVVFCTIIAYLAFNYALRIVPASQAGVYLYLNPVAAVLLANLLLSEPLTWITFLGGGMAITGVYLANGGTPPTPPPAVRREDG